MPLSKVVHSLGADQVSIAVEVTPNSSSSRITGINEWRHRLKVTLSQPAQKGEANRELISLLSQSLDIPSSDITISSGEKDRRKRVVVSSVTPAEVKLRLAAVISEGV